MLITDRTAHSPAEYRSRMREPAEVDLVVLHQTGPIFRTDDVKAHALVLPNGEVLQLHPWLARLRFGSSLWNPRCITIEHAAYLPGRYQGGQPVWWRPKPPDGWRGTAAEWRAEWDRRHPPDTEPQPAQVEASRELLRHLRDTLPALRLIGAHRQVQAGKGGCCGPDLWRECGEWAIDETGYELVETHPNGSDLPPDWRAPPKWTARSRCADGA